MKRDRWNFILLVFSCIFQCVFFRFFSVEITPYAFAAGPETFDYLQCLAICFPVFFIILLFSDYYSFHMENYGRLLLVRNCNINTMILKLFLKMAAGMAGITMVQLGINFVFFYDCSMDKTVLFRCSAVYFCIIYFLVCTVFFLSAFFKDSVVNPAVNLFLVVSCFAHGLLKNHWIKTALFTGKITGLKKLVQKESGWQTVSGEIIPVLLLTGAVYLAAVSRCRKKDIF